MLDLRWVMWSFYFPNGKHICAIWRHGISINSGDSYGHILFMFIVSFMSNIDKSKQYMYDLIDMLNDNSWYLDDIFTIDNLVLEKHNPDKYLMKLKLNKANTSDKETSSLGLHVIIKVICSEVYTSLYDKQDDFGFSIVNFPWLSGDVPTRL